MSPWRKKRRGWWRFCGTSRRERLLNAKAAKTTKEVLNAERGREGRRSAEEGDWIRARESLP